MTAPDRALPSPRAKVSCRRTWLFRGILLLMVWLAVELLSLGGLWLLHSGWSGVRVAMDAESRADSVSARRGELNEVLHPFTGFVRRPTESTRQQAGRIGVTDFGYVDDGPPLHTRGPDRVIVGILGGSVAEDLATRGWPALERELRKSPYFAGKTLVFARLALSGYKQPQQLMTVTYLLAMGGQFDLLINLDGYNEIVLPKVENAPARVFPGFPRAWQTRVTETSDLTVLRAVGRVSYLRERSRSCAAFFGRPLLRWSPALNLVWATYNSSMQHSINAEFARFNALRANDHDYAVTGPPANFADDAAYYRHCADIWQRASWQLHELCAAQNIRYFHFLQPNQYLPGSKPILSAEERAQAFNSGHWGRKPVEDGYPHLIREGTRLASQGVRFCDMTPLFVDHPEQVYSDECCHFTDHGNDLLAERIGEFVRADLAASQ